MIFLRRRVAPFLILLSVLLSPAVTPVPAAEEKKDRYSEAEQGIERFGEVYKHLLMNYYRDLSPDKIVSSGIEGMLEDLDPYTQFFNERALKQLRIDTSGKFGGLGITLGIDPRTRTPEVISVIEGTPADSAGLVAGDRIVEIEGKPSVGKPLDEVVDQLRGDPGTVVQIAVRREGVPEPAPHAIVRAQIEVKSVPYAEEVEPGIGYVRMARTRFSEETGQEVEAALRRLKERGAKGVILDLRGNPGGLLSQAREVADKFLEPGQLIVSTKGRTPDQNQDYKAQGPAVLGKETPLIVLVDRGSASASEIVAGAVQDADRGLILGMPTFGKGSVQTVVRVSDGTALKLTTALYYTPAGRSIHRQEGYGSSRAHANLTLDDRDIPIQALIDVICQATDREDARTALVKAFDLSSTQADMLLSSDLGRLAGLAPRQAEGDTTLGKQAPFKTAGGRPVYGGGGITPDVEVQPERPPRLYEELERQRMFLSFASHYAAVHQEAPRPFSADSGVVAEFRAFLADTTRGFTYKTASETRLEEVEKTFEEHKPSEAARAALATLRMECQREFDAEFARAEPVIRPAIERRVASRLWGARAEVEAGLKWDAPLQEAIRILKDPTLYAEKMGVTRVAAGKGAVREGGKPGKGVSTTRK